MAKCAQPAAVIAPPASDKNKKLLDRNVAFMQRCATGNLKKGENIRSGKWAENLPEDRRRQLLLEVCFYNNWSEKTDPTGTRAAGVVLFDGHYVMFVIREFDKTPPGVLFASTPPDMIELCLLIKHSSEI